MTDEQLNQLLDRNPVRESVANLNAPASVVRIELQSLRELNARHGESFVDNAIVAFVRAIKNLPGVAFANRIRPAEFVIGFRDLIQAEQLEDLTRLSYEHVTIRSFIGFVNISVSPDFREPPSEVLRRAWLALQQAKSESINTPSKYSEGDDARYQARLVIRNELQTQIRSEEASGQSDLFVQYQPKWSVLQSTCTSFEAFVRWKPSASLRHSLDELGVANHYIPIDLAAPVEFVDIAEEFGLVSSLTIVMMNKVMKDVAEWRKTWSDIQVAINLAAQDIEASDFANRAYKMTLDHKLVPANIAFEITERDMSYDLDQCLSSLEQLRDYGFDITIDDFGNGNSSLRQLVTFPVTDLKLDLTFVSSLEDDQTSRQIAEAVIQLGRVLSLRTIAEGVETINQAKILKDLQFDTIQGWLVDAAMDAPDIPDWIRGFKPPAM